MESERDESELWFQVKNKEVKKLVKDKSRITVMKGESCQKEISFFEEILCLIHNCQDITDHCNFFLVKTHIGTLIRNYQYTILIKH